ncbi:MAG: alternative ribosome rescue aminoacyl-tRNA hydrolase ArfB [Abyssibacter sp.]|uniref:alternative ribosome rescue aminoacyl-tRNA hydrolase ArfB n=1 Tax=Abyssibacter sp. TaxID=2320200 RepID=UPI00321C05B5
MIEIDDQWSIPSEDVRFTHIRASGPGGQHVNTTSTAVQLFFDAASSDAVPPAVLARLRTLAGSRMRSDGVIVITAQRHRSQAQNKADAIERLVSLLQRAAQTPKRRVPTRPSRASKRRRVDAKKATGRAKQLRRRPGLDS